MLELITALPGHGFWPDDLPLRQAIEPQQAMVGHRQITDAYLLGLARTHGGTVATLDRGMLSLAESAELLEVLCEP